MALTVEYLAHMGGDLLVVNAARVSFAKWKDEFDDKDAGLLRYLEQHGHESPFFHPQVCLRITAPIYVARQLFRHEVGGSKNEVSRRYVTFEPVMDVPEVIRGFPTGNRKQGSGARLDGVQEVQAKRLMESAFKEAQRAYESLLQQGVAPEQARIVLPLALETQWIWTGSLAFFARVCRDRLASDAQEETQVVARQIAQIMKELFPAAWPVTLRDVVEE